MAPVSYPALYLRPPSYPVDHRYPPYLVPEGTPCLFVLSTTSSYPDRPFDRRPLYPDRPFDRLPLYPPIYLPKRPPAALLPHSKS
ncbi:hypothetical protein PGTUg99_014831 [Puccinia graminis f. sp. tritici]|uniref:Uncharacterized protein n=1 Tax=Puccinia graminis f. sp. tritici TaxID=56615 RepID=A0A5B0RIN6_PUCGR|nr:hypothetical protein PGTUg99_014831 [Puccinia graminis f. sp. tritici]